VKSSPLNLLIAALIAFNGALMFFACGESDQTAVAQVGNKPVGIGSTQTANSKLENAVKAKLDDDEQLKAAGLTVTADVTRNQVTLAGTVSSEALRMRALELAKSAQAGVIVSDKIDVKSKASGSRPPWQGVAFV
jgi:osmotically-inducible protein OsmY